MQNVRPLIWSGLGLMSLVGWCHVATAAIEVMPPTGELVGVATSPTDGIWLVLHKEDGFVASHRITLGDRAGCLWSGKAGAYSVILFNLETKTAEVHKVTLGGGKVPDDPEEIPTGLWNLTKTAYAAGVQLVNDGHGQHIGAVADNYATVAGKILVGEITSVTAAQSKLKGLNRATLSTVQRTYWAGFNQSTTAILVAHDAEMRADIQKTAGAFSAIAEGLDLVK